MTDTAPAARDPRVRLLLIAAAALVVVVIAVIVGFVVVGALRGPEQTVHDLVRAVETEDCELFVQATTAQFRGGARTAEDCEESGMLGSGASLEYTLEVTETVVNGNTATVTGALTLVDASLPDAPPLESTISYTLVRETGMWKVDSTL